MIIAASKYGEVKRTGAETRPITPIAPKTPHIFVPTEASRRMLLRDWWWRETREGGFLREYVRREKGCMPRELRKVARVMASFTQNPKSDFRLVASVPARLYQRLKAEDPDFFADNQNLKNLRRDNPDAVVKI